MNSKNISSLSCWVLSEGIAGTENQCIAVAESLGVSFDIKRVSLTLPWRLLSPFLGFEMAWSFSPTLAPPWPDLLISSGRKSIAASRYIKKMSGGKTFTVQIQDPRINPDNFDLVAVPQHDPTRGDNVFVTDAAPNRISDKRLQDATAQFPSLQDITEPRIAVLIGGTSKAYTMSSDGVRALAEKLKTLQDGGLMITTSRRTGDDNIAILKDTLPDAYLYDGVGENPYFAMLAYADFILVTADSASMLSDACSTGKPTYMIPLGGGHSRIDRLHRHLQDIGALRVFDGQKLESYDYTPLKDAKNVADAIRERMNI